MAGIHAWTALVVQQKITRNTEPARGQQAWDFTQVLFDLLWKHVGKDGAEKNKIELSVEEGELVCRGDLMSVRIVGSAQKIGPMKPKPGVSWRDGLLAPRDGFGVYFNTIVTATQVIDEPNRQIANPRPDIEYAVLGLQATTHQFHSCIGTGARKNLPICSSVIVDAEPRRRQQHATPPIHRTLYKREDAVERIACPSRNRLDAEQQTAG